MSNFIDKTAGNEEVMKIVRDAIQREKELKRINQKEKIFISAKKFLSTKMVNKTRIYGCD